MSDIARLTAALMERLASLDHAESLLSQARIYNDAGAPADKFARHRRLINEARRHVEATRPQR